MDVFLYGALIPSEKVMSKKIFTGKWMLLLYSALFLLFPASAFLFIYLVYDTFAYEVLIVGFLIWLIFLVTNSVTGFVTIGENELKFRTYLFSVEKILLSEIKYFVAKYHRDVFVYVVSENDIEVKIGGGYFVTLLYL